MRSRGGVCAQRISPSDATIRSEQSLDARGVLNRGVCRCPRVFA
jgi:hypothetical protein